MKIELIIDENCFSYQKMLDMAKKLSLELNVKVHLLFLSELSDLQKKLSLKIIPAWIVNGEVLSIHPMNYQQLKSEVSRKFLPAFSYLEQKK